MNTRKRHWSLIELTIILVVLSILCAILAPVLDRYIRNAKIIRAREDVQAIGCCIWMFIEDTANSFFMVDAGGQGPDPVREHLGGDAPNQIANTVELLVGDGDVPEPHPGLANLWSTPIGVAAGFNVEFLAAHLVFNAPGYRTPTDLTNAGGDMFARSESGGFNSEFAWRGPYITPPIDPDPWGNRYAANVEFLDAVANSDNTQVAIDGQGGWEGDCVVMSAGPDEEIDTLWQGTEPAPLGLVIPEATAPGDDDILYIVSANSRP